MISVVIPSYNRKAGMLALLADIYRQEGVSFEVIVVDDCSPDGSAEAIAAAFPQTTVLRNEKNGGPSVTRNRGILAARGEIVVGFDSDVTVPDTRLLAKVEAAFAELPQADGLAFRLFTPDGKTDDRFRWCHPVPLDSYATSRFETSYFSGTAYAFRKKAVVAAGLYPEWFYMDFEEVLLAYRMVDQGSKMVYIPELTAIHHAHPTPRRSKILVFFKPRNQILFALACFPWPRALFYLLPRMVYNFGYALAGRHLPDYFRAMSSAWKLRSESMKRRKPLRRASWKKLAELRRGVPA